MKNKEIGQKRRGKKKERLTAKEKSISNAPQKKMNVNFPAPRRNEHNKTKNPRYPAPPTGEFLHNITGRSEEKAQGAHTHARQNPLQSRQKRKRKKQTA